MIHRCLNDSLLTKLFSPPLRCFPRYVLHHWAREVSPPARRRILTLRAR